MEKNYFGAIEFGSLNTNILILSYFQNKLSVVASTSVLSSGYNNGEIVDVDAFNISVKSALESIKDRYKINPNELILVLPNNNHKVYSAFVSNKVLTERQIIGKQQVESIRNQIKNAKVNESELLVDEVPTLYSLDNDRHLRTAPIDQRSSILAIKSNVHTLPKAMVENLKNVLVNNNIDVIGQIINCNCGVRATLTNFELENECIHVNIGQEVTTISAFYKNILIKSTQINFGIESLIIYLAHTLKIDKEFAYELIKSYFICNVDYANDVIFNDDLNLSEKRISGILLNRLYNAFNEILDAVNSLVENCKFSNDYFICLTGLLNDYQYFIDEFSKYSSLNIKDGSIDIIGLNGQTFINCYGAIVSFISLNPDYVKSRIETEEDIDLTSEDLVKTVLIEKDNSTSKFKDIFED